MAGAYEAERVLARRILEQEGQIATLKSKINGVENAVAKVANRLGDAESQLKQASMERVLLANAIQEGKELK